MTQNKMSFGSPKGKLIRWQGKFYSRKNFIKIVIGSFIMLLLPRRARAAAAKAFSLGNPSSGTAPSSVEFTSGTSWTIPAGVGVVFVEIWGGGAGGSSTQSIASYRQYYQSVDTIDAAGGGGGAYASKYISTSGLTTINYTVGGGGAVDTNGGTTTLGGSFTMTAGGGSTGSADYGSIACTGTWRNTYWARTICNRYSVPGVGGAGGTATGGTTNTSGGNGSTSTGGAAPNNGGTTTGQGGGPSAVGYSGKIRFSW